jgi:hypothetical protein
MNGTPPGKDPIVTLNLPVAAAPFGKTRPVAAVVGRNLEKSGGVRSQ